ncbi:MAG: glucose-6-phosphate 1-dehydrogenase [Actinomycetota bacterium]|nr:glucose-6-phosphate 1-dehydrogenase [Actinomycetota bacterium]
MARSSADPCIVVIFGASGDLTSRKLLPALHSLYLQELIAPGTSIVGTSRSAFSDDAFRKRIREGVRGYCGKNPVGASWNPFAQNIHYVSGDATDERSMQELGQELAQIDAEEGTKGNRVWYLATAPSLFSPIAGQIAKAGLLDTGGWQRLVVEKPFGFDLESARTLNASLADHYREDQIYRIDHYLGKETVQNVLVFRFANAIFEPIWNRRYIDHVQIMAAEQGGIEDRGTFYDQTGALRDVAQNHLLQLLSLIAMEPPVAWDADVIRDQKVQALKAVRRWSPDDCRSVVVRGQYEGYRQEEGVSSRSSTETFFAAKMYIDNWRWAEVPFYLRTGKKMPSKTTEIAIQFKRVPHLLFDRTAVQEIDPNLLVLRIQPDEGISLTFGTKVPGPEVEVRTVDMEFDYDSDFGSGRPAAYERLLLDCILGDPTLFARSDEIDQAWQIMDPIVKHWARGGRPRSYPPDTWGPEASDDLLRLDRRSWRNS